MGYLAGERSKNDASLRRAMVYGSVWGASQWRNSAWSAAALERSENTPGHALCKLTQFKL